MDIKMDDGSIAKIELCQLYEGEEVLLKVNGEYTLSLKPDGTASLGWWMSERVPFRKDSEGRLCVRTESDKENAKLKVELTMAQEVMTAAKGKIKALIDDRDRWKREALNAREVFRHRNPSATESKELYAAWDHYIQHRVREE